MCSHYQAEKRRRQIEKRFGIKLPPNWEPPRGSIYRDIHPASMAPIIRRPLERDSGDEAVPCFEVVEGHFGFPSTPTEAFQVSTDGNYYAKQIAAVRKSNRVLRVPVLEIPINTFWDIGNGDGCAIWCHQQVGPEDRFSNYHEAHGDRSCTT